MKKKSPQCFGLIALIFLSFGNLSYADSCPIPPTSIEPELSVKVNFDSKSEIYTYIYTLANGQNAKIPLHIFRIKLANIPESFQSPSSWYGKNQLDSGALKYFQWAAYVNKAIAPGAVKNGFVMKSRDAPGMVQFYALGKTSSRVGTPTPEDDEPIPDCEGFYDDLPILESMVSGITQGPVGVRRVSVDISLKDSSGKSDAGPVSPYADQGLLSVLLKMEKGHDVKEVDLASLRFGVGKATVTSSKFLGESNNLLLKFEIPKVSIECGRDRVLFLTGKLKTGVELLGGAPVKTKDCDKRPKAHLELKRR